MNQKTAAVGTIISVTAAVVLFIVLAVLFVTTILTHGTIEAAPFNQIIHLLLITLGFLIALAAMVLFMLTGHTEDEPGRSYQLNPDFRDAPDLTHEPSESFEQRLENELTFCTEHNAEVSLLLFHVPDDTGTMKQVLQEHFASSAYIYPLGINQFGVILPFYDGTTAYNELLTCLEQSSTILKKIGISCYGGMTSRYGRTIDQNTLIYEAEVSLYRAMQEDESCIMCFQTDNQQFEQALQSLN